MAYHHRFSEEEGGFGDRINTKDDIIEAMNAYGNVVALHRQLRHRQQRKSDRDEETPEARLELAKHALETVARYRNVPNSIINSGGLERVGLGHQLESLAQEILEENKTLVA